MRLFQLRKILGAVILVGLLGSGCKKDKDTVTPVDPAPSPAPTPSVSYGSLKLQFNNEVDGVPFVLGNTYTNTSGESYTVTKFNYYISNVVLTKSDNSELVIKDVYRIVKQNDDTSRSILLKNVPIGSYKAIKLMLGIDSALNNSGAHSGGLDFDYASDMFWGWNQGYIFLKLEGSAPSSTLTNNKIEYHIGGYGGVNKTQKSYALSFGVSEALVKESTVPTIHLGVNINEIFKTPILLSFSTKPQQTSLGAGAKLIADNYADMIRFIKIDN